MRGGSSKTFLHVFACMHEYLGMYVWSASHPSLNQFVQHAKPTTNFNIYVQKSFKSKSIDQANSIPRASQIGDQRLRHVARRVALTTEIMNSAGRSRSTIGPVKIPLVFLYASLYLDNVQPTKHLCGPLRVGSWLGTWNN